MSELSKKRRGIIYRKVAEMVFNESNNRYMRCCDIKPHGACCFFVNETGIEWEDLKKSFPEYFLFGNYTFTKWFDNIEDRIMALLLSYEMTK